MMRSPLGMNGNCMERILDTSNKFNANWAIQPKKGGNKLLINARDYPNISHTSLPRSNLLRSPLPFAAITSSICNCIISS